MRWSRGVFLLVPIASLIANAMPAAQPGRASSEPDLTLRPTPLFPTAWRNYANPAYCYSIRLPVSAGLDTTDLAHVKVTLTREGLDETGHKIVGTWTLELTATPNPRGIKLRDWLEDDSGTPPGANGLPEIIAILRRDDILLARKTAIRKQVEVPGRRLDLRVVSFAGWMYGLAYPALDLEHPGLLKAEQQVFEWILNSMSFGDPDKCRPGSAGS